LLNERVIAYNILKNVKYVQLFYENMGLSASP